MGLDIHEEQSQDVAHWLTGMTHPPLLPPTPVPPRKLRWPRRRPRRRPAVTHTKDFVVTRRR